MLIVWAGEIPDLLQNQPLHLQLHQRAHAAALPHTVASGEGIIPRTNTENVVTRPARTEYGRICGNTVSLVEVVELETQLHAPPGPE